MRALPVASLAVAPRRYLVAGTVAAGFPSPADDYVWDRLDMNEFLRVDATTTFFVRLDGACPEEGILDGDILVVDKSREPREGSLVIAICDGECRLRRFARGRMARLGAGDAEEAALVWGVVTGVTRALA